MLHGGSSGFGLSPAEHCASAAGPQERREGTAHCLEPIEDKLHEHGLSRNEDSSLTLSTLVCTLYQGVKQARLDLLQVCEYTIHIGQTSCRLQRKGKGQIEGRGGGIQ